MDTIDDHVHTGMVTNGNSHDHAGGDGAAITDANLSTSDITTNNATTAKHGFLPKLDNNTAHFLDGQGGWTTPSGGGLAYNNSTITTTNLTCAEDNVYNCTIAGLTANRNAVLPAPSAAGHVIRINILDGDDTYALLIIGDTGVTIDGGASAAEWSRLFIADESVTLESTSTTNWKVIVDRRIPCYGLAERQAAQSINTASTTKIALDAEVVEVGDIVDVATNDRINIRRAGNYTLIGTTSILNLDDTEFIAAYVYVDGAVVVYSINYDGLTANLEMATQVQKETALTPGQYIELYIRHSEGAAQNTSTSVVP